MSAKELRWPLVAVMLATSCAEGPPVASTSLGALAVLERMNTWRQALGDRNVQTLAEHYQHSPHVVVMWPGRVPGTDGAESITWQWTDQLMAQDAFLNQMDVVQLQLTELRVLELSDNSVAASFVGDLFLQADRALPGESFASRGSLVWVKSEERWIIVQEHISIEPLLL